MQHACRLSVVLLLAAFACLGREEVCAAEKGKPLKVCLLSGCAEYKTEESLPPFQKYLEQNFNVTCTWAVRKANDDLPGLEQLDDCDVAFVYIKRMQLAGEQLERFKKYATSGRPIVGVRTASHAVQTWLDFDRDVLGGNYKGHQPVGPVTKIELTADAGKHPILSGVEMTTANDSLYKNEGHATDINVLLTGAIPGEPVEALAWTRLYKGGRIFYTSLGTPETFQEAGFRRMLANALFWTASRDVEVRK